jgi:type I restriction enzyme S subunit
VLDEQSGTTFYGISQKSIENFPAFYPPDTEEQAAIADLLDRETTRIDGLIVQKQRLTELLRQALISETVSGVTKGFQSVGLTDSGSPWLGRIPKHFLITTLRHVCSSIQTGPFGSQLHAEEYIDDGIPVVNPSNLVAGRIIADPGLSVTEAVAARLSRHQLRYGDIVFGRRGEMGRCALVTEAEAGWLCGTGSLRLRPNQELVDPSYLASYMSLPQVCGFLTVQSVGSTMENLNERILARVPLAYPPLPEQRAIVRHVIDRQRCLQGQVTRIDHAIALLREYRAALISAAVTGQLDIRRHEKRLEALA